MDLLITDILFVALVAFGACGWMIVGVVLRKYHWRRSVERLDRIEWTRLVYALRVSSQE
jgi:hypothetical protein